MTGALQAFARRWWAGAYGVPGAFLRVLLTPLSWLWAMEARRRARGFDVSEGAVVEDMRIVSVGNLAVGGTGKTPLAAWMVRILEEGGARPALLLRGYGQDEARLHRAWNPDVPVVVDADRVRGARRAGGEGADTVVLDDGFQHRRLARHLDVVLLSADDPFPAPVLPCGPYREPASALGRADAIVLTRRVATADAARALAAAVAAVPGVRTEAVVASVCLAADDLVPLGQWAGGPHGAEARGGQPGTVPDAGEGVLALTAIARPDTLRAALESFLDGPVELMALPDHHDFTPRDIRAARARAGHRPIVVTEKDAVKLAEQAEIVGGAWVLRQRLEWDWGEDHLRSLVVGEGS